MSNRTALSGDLFHLCGPILDPGAVIRPGNWGRLLRCYGWLHSQAIREHALEQARQTIAPHLPSRLQAAFVFQTVQEAANFRGEIQPGRSLRGFEGHILYRVRLLDPDASWFVANHTLVSPPVEAGDLNCNWPAMYWTPLIPAEGGELGRVHAHAQYGSREILTLSALKIEERLGGL